MNKRFADDGGFSHVLVVVIFVLVVAVGFVGWRVATSSGKDISPSAITNTVKQNTVSTKTQPQAKQKAADSAATIDSPQKIATKDGKQYFYYGAPAGQNNASPKKVLITLHGTEGSAEKDYEIWEPFIKETKFALASLNWWDGSGDKTTDYSTPESMSSQIQEFLSSQGYAQSDLVVFEGFSRGSANSYSVVANDRASTSPVIDVAVSSSGGVETSYYNLTTKAVSAQQQAKIFAGVYWILACGGKDPNLARDGCAAAETAKTFVSGKGATVLGILSDPNGGHGALTTSSLNLTKQMFDLISTKF